MVLPPPISTLFPYTTLFRSSGAGRAAERCERARIGPRRNGHAPEDRKSTRLNSSHTVISYALYCLKIKKVMNAVSPNDIFASYNEATDQTQCALSTITYYVA